MLAEATVRKTCSVVSQACKAAVKAGALSANPFEDVPTSVGANAARECSVDAATVRRVMDAAASDELRLLIAISRFAGLRVPSEIRTLRWGSINWEHRSLRVDSPKTAKQGKPWRLVPLVPELFALMERAYDAAPEGAEFILPTFRLHSNSGMAVLRAIPAAGVQPWPRTFHAMRASCETDLASKHPLADVAAWLGHTRTVAARHYLRPTEASFAAVTGKSGGDGGEIRGDARGDNSADFVVTPVVTLSAALDRLAPPNATQVPSPPQLIAIQRVLERAGADLCDLPENLASGPDRARTDNLIHAMDALFQLSYRPRLFLRPPREGGGSRAGKCSRSWAAPQEDTGITARLHRRGTWLGWARREVSAVNGALRGL